MLYDGGYNPRTFLSWAVRQTDKEGRPLLMTGEGSSGRTTKSVRVGDSVARCVCLSTVYDTDNYGLIEGDEELPF